MFEKIKLKLIDDKIVLPYRLHKEVRVAADASGIEVRAVLMQQDKQNGDW